MIFILSVIALYFTFASNQILGVYWGAILPTLYAILVAPHALIGGTAIPRPRIEKILSDKWENANDLTAYIAKYWMALAYPTTSWKKQRNSVILYVTSFFLGFVYFAKEMFAAGIFMFAVGYVLYQMSLRVDWPRSVYTSPEFRDGSDNEFARTEWELAAMSIVAFADLYPDDQALNNSAKEISEDADVESLLAKYRHEASGWAG
jgi:hypothetical protein